MVSESYQIAIGKAVCGFYAGPRPGEGSFWVFGGRRGGCDAVSCSAVLGEGSCASWGGSSRCGGGAVSVAANNSGKSARS